MALRAQQGQRVCPNASEHGNGDDIEGVPPRDVSKCAPIEEPRAANRPTSVDLSPLTTYLPISNRCRRPPDLWSHGPAKEHRIALE